MLRKNSLSNSTGFLVVAVLIVFALSFAITYSLARRYDNPQNPAASLASPNNDRVRNGLNGPVEKVRTEIAALSNKSGVLAESPRELMETTTYDPQGKIIDSSYYPVSHTAKSGKEEYSYDDKGNINGKTVRDADNAIVSKESYAYEYDSVGNWTKMTASRLVYENGALKQRPAEVTYRNITYYFDQSIADKVNPSSLKQNSGQEKDTASSLQAALDAWIAATNARDIEKLMSFYDSRVDIFYLARNVSQDSVRAEKLRLFQRADVLDIRAVAPEITLNSDGYLATMRFRKSYFIKEGRRIRQGEVLQQLRWQRTAGGWKITGERDEQVIR